jgi:hypothetical protein
MYSEGGALIAGDKNIPIFKYKIHKNKRKKRWLVRGLRSLSLIRHEEAGAELYARLERPHPPRSIFSWPIDSTLMLGI